MSIPRFILRWGLISALALGGATLLIGPERVAAGLAHVRAQAQSVVDHAIDDPMVLRRQLEELADEYPDRIAKVQGEVAEVEHQIMQFDHDNEIASRVVAMTASDLGELKTLIARAEEVENDGRVVAVRFEGVRFNLDQAYNEARRINNVRGNYSDRLACNDQQLTLLTQQKTHLVDILTTLEDEYTTFETQMWQLDRKIDAIERNQRMIEMTEELQATLQTYDKWGKVGNLKQLEAKLAELQTIQEAQLAALEKKGVRYDYEKRAKYELDMETAPADDPFRGVEEIDTEVEIHDEADSFAFLGPVIVE
jgi:chromosome segregation ATPase